MIDVKKMNRHYNGLDCIDFKTNDGKNIRVIFDSETNKLRVIADDKIVLDANQKGGDSIEKFTRIIELESFGRD